MLIIKPMTHTVPAPNKRPVTPLRKLLLSTLEPYCSMPSQTIGIIQVSANTKIGADKTTGIVLTRKNIVAAPNANPVHLQHKTNV